jgi:hypothetical protein
MAKDDIVLAPWTTIKYRVTGSTLTTANQSTSSGSSDSVNTLSNLSLNRLQGLLTRRREFTALCCADELLSLRLIRSSQSLLFCLSASSLSSRLTSLSDTQYTQSTSQAQTNHVLSS